MITNNRTHVKPFPISRSTALANWSTANTPDVTHTAYGCWSISTTTVADTRPSNSMRAVHHVELVDSKRGGKRGDIVKYISIIKSSVSAANTP